MIHPPVNQLIQVTVVEPWEFYPPTVRNPFTARVSDTSMDPSIATLGGIVIQALAPFDFGGQRCEYFVGSRRHAEPEMGPRDWQDAVYSFTAIPTERAVGATPFDLSWWRGGVGLIAGINLAAPEES